MYEEGGLAVTGMGVGIMGHQVGLGPIVSTGVALIVIGAAIVRATTKKRRYSGGRA